MSATMRWNPEAFERKLEAAGNDAVFAGARVMEKQAAVNIGVQGPPRSLPGNFPHKDTQNLWNSITSARLPRSGSTLWAAFGTSVFYGKLLEFGTAKMEPRPWIMRSALMAVNPAIEAIRFTLQSGLGMPVRRVG